jgi:hypothetical protein
VPWINGLDVTRRPRWTWIIDFPPGTSLGDASLYEAPFAYLEEHVREIRATARSGDATGVAWWIHQRPRPEMREQIRRTPCFLATARVSKHRLFGWITNPTLPDCQLIVFARDDDYFFGVLHSRVHEVWALRQGTQLETRPRYTPTSCFETFPFPNPTPDQAAAIATAAKELDRLRSNWLNPPQWTKTAILKFPGSVDGPWARYIRGPDSRRIGTVRWPRLVPKDADCAESLRSRTLTNLYNERPTWLDLAHKKLDAAVFAAYGWDPNIPDEEILERLLALNLKRSAVG